jgi:uncharacterized cupredoxin-like copper-binding protein
MFCFRRLTALALFGAVSAACKSDRPSPSTETAGPGHTGSRPAATVAVTATDFAFDGPAQLPTGANTFQLVNQGKELHQIQLIKLENGKTADDLVKALKKPGPLPSWIKFAGGPNGITPGAETRATAVLAPGNYAYICLIPSPDGTIHAAKGMLRAFEVTGDSTATTAAELPRASVTIKLADYDFHSSKPLTSGRHTILVQNAGPQPHELVLLKLGPGKKVEDFAHWAETGLKGPPPGEPLGGVAVLDQGGQGTFTVDLTPGEYGLICFVPDAKDGKLHLAHGMMKNITVS